MVSKAQNVGTVNPSNPLKLVDDGLEAGYTYRYQVTYSVTNTAGTCRAGSRRRSTPPLGLRHRQALRR